MLEEASRPKELSSSRDGVGAWATVRSGGKTLTAPGEAPLNAIEPLLAPRGKQIDLPLLRRTIADLHEAYSIRRSSVNLGL